MHPFDAPNLGHRPPRHGPVCLGLALGLIIAFVLFIAAGLNAPEHSVRLLAAHDVAQRLELHQAMRSKWLRDHPHASTVEFAAFSQALWRELGRVGA